jgi:hypothetical protein
MTTEAVRVQSTRSKTVQNQEFMALE